jgi:hypothetical protein
MCNHSTVSGVALLTAISCLPIVASRTAVPSRATTAQSRVESTKMPDLSGDWANDPSGIGGSLSLSDPRGRNRGKETDIPYQSWALEKTMSENTPTGSESNFEETTDPNINYCEPVGLMRVYMWPTKSKFIQTPDAVYILYEYGVNFRVVRLNSKHPGDPDPQWWGDSIGWYENGDTLVVDTIGFNDKTWLDQVGHPHTEKLHTIERYKRLDANTLDLDITIDDPGAYTKSWHGHRKMPLSHTGFLRYQWACSTRENQDFLEKLGKPAMGPSPGK